MRRGSTRIGVRGSTYSTPVNVYVPDKIGGVVLYPGVDQLGVLGRNVDLVAQVSGATVSSYSWNTTGVSGSASSISGTSTNELTFQWHSTNDVAEQVSVTLSVTDTNSHTHTYTYDFWLPEGGGTAQSGGGEPTWPTSLAPSQELLSAPAFPSDNASVDATSGSLDTEIDLPSYNPNVPALSP